MKSKLILGGMLLLGLASLLIIMNGDQQVNTINLKLDDNHIEVDNSILILPDEEVLSNQESYIEVLKRYDKEK